VKASRLAQMKTVSKKINTGNGAKFQEKSMK
jgi:hypothetical protein